MSILHYLSEPVVEELKQNIEANLEYYRGDGFSDFSSQIGWNIRFEGREFDLQSLESLDGKERTAASDLENSKLVWKALSGLSPSEANEEQIWIRLSHVEAFQYTKDRWFASGADDEKQISSVKIHFFATGRGGIRDDHALSRLWWNAYIANLAYPEDPNRALELILKSADIRSNIVERSSMSIIQPLLHAILYVLDEHEDVFKKSENKDDKDKQDRDKFREFMKNINLKGAGMVFEAMKQSDVDAFALGCLE